MSNSQIVTKVLSNLLEQIQPVDFRARVEERQSLKIPMKLYVVMAIDEVIRIATTNDWGLGTKDGFIYVYNGMYWMSIETDDFKSFLGRAAIKMGVPTLEGKHYHFRDELLKQFLSTSHLQTPERGRVVQVNLLNGTFDITDEKQELREPRREDFLTYQLPFKYDPDARCPLFDKYLTRVLPDEKCRMVLAEYIGYIFINNLKLHKALILYGSGANGKSVFFDIVNALLGRENICSYSLQNLTKQSSYQRAELSNKLLNYASEINGCLEASIFKQLVSGEPVEARHIYGRPFTMTEYGKLMFNCNELPREVEQTLAFFRRFIIIPFDQTIPEEEQDPELAQKIIATELSGIWNWVMEGLRRVLENRRFSDSEIVKQQVEAYRKTSDTVAMFLDDEGYRATKGVPITLLKHMYDDYKIYCLNGGYKACSIRTFADRLRNIPFQTEKIRAGIQVYATKRPEEKPESDACDACDDKNELPF